MSKTEFDLCIIIPDMEGGGTQRVVLNLIKNWSDKKKKICVITFSSEETDFFKLPTSVHRECVDFIGESNNTLSAIWNNIRRVKVLRSIIKNYQPKLVLSFLGTTNILSIAATFFTNIPIVISERSDPAKDSLGVRWDKLRYLLYRHANIVTANSLGALKILEKFVDSRKLKYVPNPVSIEKPSVLVKYDFPVILAVGRLGHEKGYDILLSAFSKFIPQFPNWRLVIVGDGKLRDNLKQLTSILGIADYVTWCGLKPDVFAYYSAATIFTMPSRFEGTPNALLEAMAFGLPVIVSNASTGMLKFVENEETGLVVPTEDVDSLSAALCRLANDELLRKKLGKKARQRVETETHFSYDVWDSVLNIQ